MDPPGFAHGFLVISDNAEVFYKSTDYYDPPSERTLAWNDSDLNIDWQLGAAAPILSENDKRGSPLRSAEVFD